MKTRGAWGSSCQYGDCLTLDGIDDYLTVADPGGPYSIGVGESVTISAWVKRTDEIGTNTILKRVSNINLGNYMLDAQNASGGIGPRFRYTNTTPANQVWTGTESDGTDPNEWHHYVIIHAFHNTTPVTAGYLDGASTGGSWTTGKGIGTPDESAITNLCIGADCGTVDQYFLNGSIDDLTLWNKSLSQDEITTLAAPNKLSVSLDN
ncbi:MAG: LamG domain-containing protein [Candidatus Altiarchaeota archaeon]